MHQTFDITIVGGGLVGASLALALVTGSHAQTQSPLRIAVIDPQPLPQPLMFTPERVEDVRARVSALSLASQRFLEHLGAWKRIPAERLSSYRCMQVWDAESSGHIEFNAADLHLDALGHIVENDHIVRALRDLIDENPHICWLAQSLVGLESDSEGAELTLASGDAIRTKLLVAADGARSQVRQLANIPVRQWSYEQRALVATIETQKPHNQTAYQCFRASGPLAYLPLSQPNLSSIVWSLDSDQMDEIESLEAQELRKHLGLGMEYQLGEVVSISERAVFPLVQSHAKRYWHQRILLIGDAAHSIHPLAGQGVNLGFMDAAVLAEELIKGFKKGLPAGEASVLMAYERRRMPENLAAMAAMECFKRLFGQSALPFVLLRSCGMKGVNRLPWVKQHSMLTALGFSGDVPAVLKTQNLGFPRLDL